MRSTKKQCDCKKDYTGVLKDPIVIGSTSNEKEVRAKLFIEDMTKIGALCDHFGIKELYGEARFLLLALALARKHIPGFAVVNALPKKHRQQDVNEDIYIYAAIEQQLKIAGDGNIRGAAWAVATRNPEFEDFKKRPDSLRTRYLRIKKSVDKLAHDLDNEKTKHSPINENNYSKFAVLINTMKIMARKLGAPEDEITFNELAFQLAQRLSPLSQRIPKKKNSPLPPRKPKKKTL